MSGQSREAALIRRRPLHPTAAAVLGYVVGFKREHAGDSPTVREIADALDIPSTSTVNHHLVMLERRGLIFRPLGRARSIAIPGARWVGPDEAATATTTATSSRSVMPLPTRTS